MISSCGPTEVITTDDDSQESAESERLWMTWETCSQIPGDHPCNFTLSDQHGDDIELYSFYDKVIVIDLSAMWCSVCQNIAPYESILVQEFGEENFVWITILLENENGSAPSQSDLQRWASTYGINGPVLGGDRSLIDMTAQSGYPLSSWPTLIVVDKEMTIVNGVNGWSESLVRSWIESSM